MRITTTLILGFLSLLLVSTSVNAQTLNPLAPEQLVNTDIPAYQFRSAIATDDLGNYVATWHTGSYGPVFARRYNSSHVAISPVMTITTDNIKQMNIEHWEDGKYVISYWHGGDLFYRILYANNTVSSARLIIVDAQEDHYDFDINGDSIAFIYIKIPSSSAVVKNVYLRGQNLNTASWLAPEIQVNQPGIYKSLRYPRVVYHPTGRMTTMYQGRYQWGTVSSDSDNRLSTRTFNSSYAAEGAETIHISEDSEDLVFTGADIEGNANSEVVIVINHGKISNLHRYVRMWTIDAMGNYLVHDDTLLDDPSTTSLYSQPSVQLYNDGSYVVGMGLKFASTNADESMVLYGAPYNSQNSGWIIVHSWTNGIQRYPDVAKLPNNDFVISWAGQGPTDTQGTYLRAFSGYGFPGIGSNVGGSATVAETGSTQTIDFVLNTQPTGNVTVNLSSSDLGEGTLSASQLTFTSANWNVAQQVTLTGVDDPADDGDISFLINVNFAGSADATYAGLSASTIAAVNLDDDATMGVLSNQSECQSDGIDIASYIVTNVGGTITGLTGTSSNQGVVDDSDISIVNINATTWSISIANLGNNTTGTSTITVTATDGTFDYTETFDLTTTGPTANGGVDMDVCDGLPITLTATGALTYSWTGGITNGDPFVPVSTATYTVTGTDAMGCENSDDVLVTVNSLPTIDAGSPVTVCSGSSVTLTATGGNTYSWTGGVTNGDPFIPGATLNYTVTGTDASGCQNTDDVLVAVNFIPVTPGSISGDVAICSGISGTYSISPVAGATSYTWVLPSGWTGSSTTTSITAIAGSTGGNITVTANNTCGSSSAQVQNIVINDISAPVPDAASLSDVVSQCSITSLVAPTATDNCAGIITGTPNVTLPISTQGSFTITWTFNDGNGNTSTQSQVLTISDVTSPVVDNAILAPVSAQCSVTNLTAPTATDNCAGSVTGTHNATFPITSSTTITWTYNDGNGNTSTQTQSVNVNDVTAPVADNGSLSVVNAECSVTSLTAPTATDNCVGSITGTHNATFPITSNTTITWTYDDGNGNSSTQSQTVTINDVTPPVADLGSLATLTGQCEITSLTAPTATDNCAGSITGTHNASLPITSSTIITWTYDDGNNTSTQTQSVTINDVTAPVADLGSLTMLTDQCEITSLTAPTATDNCAGAITGTHNASLPITSSTTITWTYDDGSGNTSTQTQTVTINDVTAPVADLGSLSTLTDQCEITALNPPTATDNCVGAITGTHNASLPITSSTTVTWTFDDGNGNTSTQTQTVTINDVTAPVANLGSLTTLTDECEITSLTAPTATDNCVGTITGAHTASLPISSSTTITWTYDDGNGNTSTQTQTVTINDVTPPVANNVSLTDVISECSVVSLSSPTAIDNCVGSITGTHNASLPITTQGTTVVIWTYDDGSGNTSTQTQNVVITDVSAPIADNGSLSDVTGECSVTNLIAPTATDNCLGSITGTHNATLPISTQGTTVVTWTYDDGHGNTSSQMQNVVITDVTAPLADLSSLSDVTGECSVTSLTAPTATDNCVGSITGTHTATLPIIAQGTTVVTWTYDDGLGNTSTQTQNVVITDVTAPVADNGSLSDVTGECSVTSLTAPTSTDNCAGAIVGTHNASLPITNQGTTTVTWTYDDGNGNTSTQTQDVIIADMTEPTADLANLSDLTAECSVISLTAPTAVDNCAGALTGTHNVSLPITGQGTTTVTWTYDDGNGNTSTQTQNIVIADATAPTADLATLADINDECEVTPTAPTATDNCAGALTGTPDVSFPITVSGTTTVTWTYDDGNGNTSTQTQDVIITPIDDGITQVDAITLSADATGYNYQWIDCDNGNAPVSGATSQSFTPTVAGNYACEIDNGTCTVTTACLSSSVGIDENTFGSTLTVYPNPTFGNLKVNLGDVYNDVAVTIYNALGQAISNDVFGSSDQINLSIDAAPGMYVLEIKTKEGKTARVNIIKK